MRARSIGAWAMGLVGVAALGCGSGVGGYGGSSAPAPAPAPCTAATATAVTNGTITIAGMSYAPACAKVTAGPQGTTVTFANDDSVAHTVTADDASFDSGAVAPGTQFTHTFAAAGTVGIHCTIHAGMRMTLFVQ